MQKIDTVIEMYENDDYKRKLSLKHGCTNSEDVRLFRVELYNPDLKVFHNPVCVIAKDAAAAISQATCQPDFKEYHRYGDTEFSHTIDTKSKVTIEPLLIRGWGGEIF